jgi:hypothetical protein
MKTETTSTLKVTEKGLKEGYMLQLLQLKVEDLRYQAAELNIKGRSKMTKSELVRAIADA